MRLPCVLLVLMIVISAQTRPNGVERSPRVRVLDAAWATLLERGLSRSETLRLIVSELERSDVIVHVVKTIADDRRNTAALQFVIASGGVRFLRIRLAAGRFSKSRFHIATRRRAVLTRR